MEDGCQWCASRLLSSAVSEDQRRRGHTCVLELDLIEALLVGLVGAGEDQSVQCFQVWRVLASQ